MTSDVILYSCYLTDRQFATVLEQMAKSWDAGSPTRLESIVRYAMRPR